MTSPPSRTGMRFVSLADADNQNQRQCQPINTALVASASSPWTIAPVSTRAFQIGRPPGRLCHKCDLSVRDGETDADEQASPGCPARVQVSFAKTMARRLISHASIEEK